MIAAQDGDLDRFIDLMEEVADWLKARGINQWRPGTFRRERSRFVQERTGQNRARWVA